MPVHAGTIGYVIRPPGRHAARVIRDAVHLPAFPPDGDATVDLYPAHDARPAPELEVAGWLDVTHPMSLHALRGQVVLLHAFQMLCPGCVRHGLPQATSVHARLAGRGVAVIGLHTVFEHHAVMGRDALLAFAHEYRLGFPIAIDRPASDSPVPRTMAQYGFRGTPGLALIDHRGRLRGMAFGRVDDLALGTALGRLLLERELDMAGDVGDCTSSGCPLPGDGARAA